MNNNWLPRALEESRARGFLGPNSIEPHIAHAEGFALVWESLRATPPQSFLDLGSGGGLPGLVLLQRWGCRAILTDSMEKRMNFLREALEEPGAPAGGEVITARAEELSREPGMTESVDLVTARSFGPPSVAAECGVRFLKVGGLMIVSEPPNDEDNSRWPADGLGRLGLKPVERIRMGAAYQVLEKIRSTPDTYPRQSGTPKKQPLF